MVFLSHLVHNSTPGDPHRCFWLFSLSLPITQSFVAPVGRFCIAVQLITLLYCVFRYVLKFFMFCSSTCASCKGSKPS